MSEMRNVWNDTLTTILLQEYEKNDFLWNAFSPYYTNKKKREEGYNRIIEALNTSTITIRDIKMKLKNLRSSYSLELKKIRDSALNGDREYGPKVWWFYKMDRFLRDVVVPQDSTHATPIEIHQDPLYEVVKEEFISSDPIEYKPLCSKLTTKKRKQIDKEKKERKLSKIEVVEANTSTVQMNSPTPSPLPHIHHSIATRTDLEDEFDAFGRNMAHQLRTLPLDVALRLQIKLQTMIAETRLSLNRQKHRMEMFDNVSSHFEFDLTNQSDDLHNNS